MVLIMGATSAMAQKQFTLEDLNFGGKNYRQMSPQNRTLYWWGDKLVHATDSLCSLVDVNTAKEKPLFTLDQMREWSELGKKLRSLRGVSMPYAGKPLALVQTAKKRILVNFRTKMWSGAKIARKKRKRRTGASKAVPWRLLMATTCMCVMPQGN